MVKYDRAGLLPHSSGVNPADQFLFLEIFFVQHVLVNVSRISFSRLLKMDTDSWKLRVNLVVLATLFAYLGISTLECKAYFRVESEFARKAELSLFCFFLSYLICSV